MVPSTCEIPEERRPADLHERHHSLPPEPASAVQFADLSSPLHGLGVTCPAGQEATQLLVGTNDDPLVQVRVDDRPRLGERLLPEGPGVRVPHEPAPDNACPWVR